jgi:hypothetical protein
MAKLAALISLVVGIVLYRLSTNGSFATFSYMVISYLADFDHDQLFITNFDGEIEDEFTHRFVPLDHTFYGLPVNATYHVVECGNADAEAIVFGHGLCENWRVWKTIMREFCGTHRVIAYDSEGMGQSAWDNILRDLPKGKSMNFMADMQMEMLKRIGVHKFNLVITDYSFWSTLSMLSDFGDVILRYGKFQSVGNKYNIMSLLSCSVILCYIMLCYIMLYYVMLYYEIHNTINRQNYSVYYETNFLHSPVYYSFMPCVSCMHVCHVCMYVCIL